MSPVNSPNKWPVTRKIFSFDDVIMDQIGILHNQTEPPTFCIMRHSWIVTHISVRKLDPRHEPMLIHHQQDQTGGWSNEISSNHTKFIKKIFCFSLRRRRQTGPCLHNISHKMYTWLCSALFYYGYIIVLVRFMWHICRYFSEPRH